MRTYRLLVALLLLAPSLAADWPRFRGPGGSGVIDDPAMAADLGASDVLFKVPIPGRGNSSPVISKGRLFLQSATEDGKERRLHCYDAGSLKSLWTATVAGGPGKTHAKNSLASSTPAADGERVCALFWNGQEIALHAFDFAGTELWQAPLGRFASQHGCGQSPILHAGKVYLNNDQDGHAELLCFDAATGKKVWSAERKAFRSCYSTPFVRSDGDGGNEILVASTAGLAGYHPSTGKLRWQWDWPFDVKPLRTVGSPIEGAGLLIAVSGDGDGSRHMVAVAPPASGEPARLVWEKKRGTPYVPGPLVRGEYVYWVSDTGFAACCEAKTGRIVFDERLTTGITSSPILLNGHVFCVDERGSVFMFPAEPKFQRPRRVNLDEPVYASPAAAAGRIYVRGEQHLFVIGRREKPADKP